MAKNYMDRFETPEDFIRHAITSNRGTQNVLDKYELISLALTHDIDINPQKMTKDEIYLRVIEKVPLEEICKKCRHLGVSSHSFQQKFNVTHKEVKRMARSGFIKITGSERFRAYGKECYADLYSVYDYFRLTAEEVHNWLNYVNVNVNVADSIKKPRDQIEDFKESDTSSTN